MYSIAIDGPSGAGKSTLAKALAQKLGFLYVDTGAIYRTVGLFAKQNGIDPLDEGALSERFGEIDIELRWIDGSQHVFLCGNDVSGLIRTPEMSRYASMVSSLPAVRKFLLEKQRNFSRTNNVIMDGRDIGTVVLPCADVKIFLTASIESRAKRRYDELIAAGQDVVFDEVRDDMKKRDETDSGRKTAPCVAAEDAVILDDSGMSLEQTTDKALEIVYEKINDLL